MKTIIKILITLTISLISKINNVQELNESSIDTLSDQKTEIETIYNYSQTKQIISLKLITNCQK